MFKVLGECEAHLLLEMCIDAEIQGDPMSLMEDSVVFTERVRKIREDPPGGKK